MKYIKTSWAKFINESNNYTEVDLQNALNDISPLISKVVNQRIHDQFHQIKNEIEQNLKKGDLKTIEELEKNVYTDWHGAAQSIMKKAIDVFKNYKSTEDYTIKDLSGNPLVLYKIGDMEFSKFEDDRIDELKYNIKLKNPMIIVGKSPFDTISQTQISEAEKSENDGVILKFLDDIITVIAFEENQIVII